MEIIEESGDRRNRFRHSKICGVRLDIALVVLVTAKAAVVWFSTDRMNPDKVVQISCAHALLDGRGLSQCEIREHQGKAVLHVAPMTGWAPGYALVVAGGMFAFDDIFLFDALLDYTSLLVFFLAWWNITCCMREAFPPVLLTFFWALWLVLPTPTDYVTSSGLLALSLFSASNAVLLRGIKTDGQPTISILVLSGLLAGLAAWAHFRYLPLILVGPITLLVSNVKSVSKISSWPAISSAAGVALGVVPLLALQLIRVGGLTGNSPTASGWNWSELSTWYPFPAMAIGFPDVAAYIAYKFPPMQSFIQSHSVAWIVSLVTLSIFVAVGTPTLLRALDAGNGYSLRVTITLIGALVFLLVTAMLAWHTLRHPVQILGTDTQWTAVSDKRYYAPILPFMTLALAGFAYHTIPRVPFRFHHLAFLALAVIIVIAGFSRYRAALTYALDYKGMRRHINTVRSKDFDSLIRVSIAHAAAGDNLVIADLSTDGQRVGTGSSLAAGAIPAYFPISQTQCRQIADEIDTDITLLRFCPAKAGNAQILSTAGDRLLRRGEWSIESLRLERASE